MGKRLTVKQWDEADRPREKLLTQGPQALSDAELLAILIGSGTLEETAVDVTRRILEGVGGKLRRLGRLSCRELCQHKGIGQAKAVTLMAACELGRRRETEPADERPRMDSPACIYEYFRRLEDADCEEFHVMLMNQNLRLIGTVCIGKGGLTGTAADVRLVLREALIQKAPHIAVCHNHPSGNPRPSTTDNQLTDKIRRAAEVMDIRLVDHIIVGDGIYYSYQEQGKL